MSIAHLVHTAILMYNHVFKVFKPCSAVPSDDEDADPSLLRRRDDFVEGSGSTEEDQAAGSGETPLAIPQGGDDM